MRAALDDRRGQLPRRRAGPADLREHRVQDAPVAGTRQRDTLSLQQFELGAGGESTIRSVAIGSSGQLTQETRWRRSDGSTFDVEVAATVVGGAGGNRVLTVRDVSARRRAQERADRESRRSTGLLDLAQRAHSSTESEVLSHALELVQKLTGSEAGYVFLATSDAGHTSSPRDATALRPRTTCRCSRAGAACLRPTLRCSTA